MRAVVITPAGGTRRAGHRHGAGAARRSGAGEGQRDGSFAQFRDVRARQHFAGGQRMPHIAGSGFAGTVVETAVGGAVTLITGQGVFLVYAGCSLTCWLYAV